MNRIEQILKNVGGIDMNVPNLAACRDKDALFEFSKRQYLRAIASHLFCNRDGALEATLKLQAYAHLQSRILGKKPLFHSPELKERVDELMGLLDDIDMSQQNSIFSELPDWAKWNED